MLNLFPKLRIVSSPANLPLRAKGRRVRNSRPVLSTRDHILTHPSSFKKERRKEAFLGNGVYLKPDKAHNCNLGRLRQKNHEFQPSWDYRGTDCFNI